MKKETDIHKRSKVREEMSNEEKKSTTMAMQDIPEREERTYTESWVESITKGGWEQRKRFWEISKPSRWEGFDRSLNSVEYEVLRDPQILFLEWFGGEGGDVAQSIAEEEGVAGQEREEPVNVPKQDSSLKLSTLERRGSYLRCWQDEKSVDRDDINGFRSKINREKEVSDKKTKPTIREGRRILLREEVTCWIRMWEEGGVPLEWVTIWSKSV